MKEAGVVPEVDNEDEDEEEGPVVIDQGEKEEAAAGHTHSGDDHSSRSKCADQVPNDGSFESSFETGGAIQERDGRAAGLEIVLQGKKEDGEPVEEDSAPHRVDQRSKGNDPPAVKDPTSAGAEETPWDERGSAVVCHGLHLMYLPLGFQL